MYAAGEQPGGGITARINIDDRFWNDVTEVATRLGGDLDKAIGLSLRWFRYVQTEVKSQRQINTTDFRARFGEALCPFFAVIEGDIVKPVGEADQFGWLSKLSIAGKSGGSKTSDAKRRAALEREAKKREERKPQADHNHKPNHNSLVVSKDNENNQLDMVEAQPPQPSYSYSHSSSKEDLLKETKSSNSITTVLPSNAPSRTVLVKFSSEGELFRAIPSAQLDRWRTAYEAEFLKKEFVNAFGWYENNPRKMPKNLRGWINALNSWFSRGYVRYQQGIAANPAKTKTASQIAKEYEEQQRQRRDFDD